MVQLGLARHRDVQLLPGQVGDQVEGALLGGDVQIPPDGGVEVADPHGLQTDRERRHQVVEEAVEVIRSEGDHQGRINLLDEGTDLVEDRVHLIPDAGRAH